MVADGYASHQRTFFDPEAVCRLKWVMFKDAVPHHPSGRRGTALHHPPEGGATCKGGLPGQTGRTHTPANPVFSSPQGNHPPQRARYTPWGVPSGYRPHSDSTPA